MEQAMQPMHKDFARWYSAVSLGDDVARRNARWEGICAVVSDAERPTVETLLRLAFGGRAAPAAKVVQTIRQAFKSADETFEMAGNDREMQVLAGAALAVLMEDTEGSEGAAAALSVTTASLGGARKPDLPMDLPALGEIAIGYWAEANRKRPTLKNFFSVEVPQVDFSKAAAKVRELQNWDGVAEAFNLAAKGASLSMRTLVQRHAEAVEAIDDFIRVQDEELQMLWWLISQRSENYDCAFDAVPAEAQPFVFARELADATEFLPGPSSVKALLSRAGLKERRKIAVTAAVNAPRTDWLERVIADADPSPLSTPLHAAIKRQLETGAGTAWVAGWAASSGVDEAHALPGLMLGELFYRERLLLLFG